MGTDSQGTVRLHFDLSDPKVIALTPFLHDIEETLKHVFAFFSFAAVDEMLAVHDAFFGCVFNVLESLESLEYSWYCSATDEDERS